jgi:hypothetical protein
VIIGCPAEALGSPLVAFAVLAGSLVGLIHPQKQ